MNTGDVERPWAVVAPIVSRLPRPFWIKAGELNASSVFSKSRPGGSGYSALHYVRSTSACVGSS